MLRSPPREIPVCGGHFISSGAGADDASDGSESSEDDEVLDEEDEESLMRKTEAGEHIDPHAWVRAFAADPVMSDVARLDQQVFRDRIEIELRTKGDWQVTR